MLCFNFLQPLLGLRQQEEPSLLEIMLESACSPLHLLLTCFLAPVAEELFFRALLFARAVASSGAFAGYASSSLFFGAMHFSPEATKVIDCCVAGLLLACSYRLTLSIAAPIVLHVVNNSMQALCVLSVSPHAEPRTLCNTMPWMAWWMHVTQEAQCVCAEACAFVLPHNPWMKKEEKKKSRRAAGEEEEEEQAEHPRRFVDGFERLLSDVFFLLDRNNKGYLTVPELAFFRTLEDTTLSLLIASFSVIRRHESSSAFLQQTIEESRASLVSTESLSLPSTRYFSSSSDAQVGALRRLYDAMTEANSELRVAFPDELIHAPSRSLKELQAATKLDEIATSTWLHRYYSLFVSSIYEHHWKLMLNDVPSSRRSVTPSAALLSSEAASTSIPSIHDDRITREQFLNGCFALAVTNPRALNEMVRQLTLIALGNQAHPLALLPSHSS